MDRPTNDDFNLLGPDSGFTNLCELLTEGSEDNKRTGNTIEGEYFETKNGKVFIISISHTKVNGHKAVDFRIPINSTNLKDLSKIGPCINGLAMCLDEKDYFLVGKPDVQYSTASRIWGEKLYDALTSSAIDYSMGKPKTIQEKVLMIDAYCTQVIAGKSPAFEFTILKQNQAVVLGTTDTKDGIDAQVGILINKKSAGYDPDGRPLDEG